MGPISFCDQKIFRMGSSKKMRWTAAALVARFVVLAADGHVHPDKRSHPFTNSKREGEKHVEESFPP